LLSLKCFLLLEFQIQISTRLITREKHVQFDFGNADIASKDLRI